MKRNKINCSTIRTFLWITNNEFRSDLRKEYSYISPFFLEFTSLSNSITLLALASSLSVVLLSLLDWQTFEKGIHVTGYYDLLGTHPS